MKEIFTYSMCSEIGDREVNEDSIDICAVDRRTFFLLADGLGGQGYGKEASESIIQNSIKYIAENGKMDIGECLKGLFCSGHEYLCQIQQKKGNIQALKTTFAVAAVEDGKIWTAHIGDSRIYVFNKKRLIHRSLDHSVPQMLSLSGAITEKQIRYHPDRNRLLRCLGDNIKIPGFEIAEPIKIEKGISVLLCSDGFWEPLSDREIACSLRWSRNAEGWLNHMKKKIKKRKTSKMRQDNYSAIAIWFL